MLRMGDRSGYLAAAMYTFTALAGGIAILFFTFVMALGALQLINYML
jgi:hypothetical protein